MNLNDLNVFLEVCRAGSFIGAARSRDMDASTISRTIAALEARLGIRLFQRSTRRVTLTEAGQRYRDSVAPLVEELARAEADARNLRQRPSGTLRLSTSVNFGQRRVIPILPGFRRLYPEIKLECLFSDTNVDLVAEGVDLALRLAPAVSGDLITAKLIDTRYRVVASPDYLASAPALKKPADLTRHRCLLFNLPGYRNRWLFRDAAGGIEEIPVDGDLILSPAGAVYEATVAGMGPALLADWAAEKDILSGRLIDLFPGFEATATTFDTAVWLAYPSRRYLPAKVRVMIDFLRQTLRPADLPVASGI